MTHGIRAKLFFASIAVILVVGSVSALLLRSELTETVERRVQAELLNHARGARVGVESLPVIDGPVGAETARRFADATGTQVDLILDGALVATSADPPPGAILTRSEIHAALAGEIGVARRGGVAFVAVPFARPDGRQGVVRVSAPMRELDAAYGRLYLLLAIAAAVGVLTAVVMTWIASSIMTRSVRRLAHSARDLADGEVRRIPVETSDDEIGVLGGSLNQMAEGMERTVSELSRERGLLESVLDSISQGVVALDPERRIILMNDAARFILELDSAQVGSALIDHVRIPAVLELLPAAGSDVTEAGTAEFQTPRGARVVARVAPLRAGEGCILMLQDVTAMRRLETIRRDFVANVSHELRTPVSIVRANAETLLAGAKDDPKFATKLIDGLHRNAERLARILADLLDLSRLEAGQYRIEASPVAVRAAVDQAAASLDDTAAKKQIEVVVDVGDDLGVRADPKALDQVLVNLIDNAIKYNPGGGHVWVEARRARQGTVRIDVRDDGPGIAARHRERIFERFYRVDPGRSREMGGTGLGLSIVKHLVESMGGLVGVAGNEPRGTVFWIELPAAVTDPGCATNLAQPNDSSGISA